MSNEQSALLPSPTTVPTPAEARAILKQKEAAAEAAWEKVGKDALVAYVGAELTREIRAGHAEFSISMLDVARALRATTDAEFGTHKLNLAVIAAVEAAGYYAGGKRWSYVQVNTQHSVYNGDCTDDCTIL